MFRVLPFVRFVYSFLSVVMITVVWFLTKEPLLLLLSVGFSVWFQFYLSGFCLQVQGDRLVRTGGSIFQRKTVYMLKTACFARIVAVHPRLPALIRIQYPGERVFLIGLSGRQVKLLEKIIERN